MSLQSTVYRGGGTKQYGQNYEFISHYAYSQFAKEIERSYFFDDSISQTNVGSPTVTPFTDGSGPRGIDIDNNVLSIAELNNEVLRPKTTVAGLKYKKYTATVAGDGVKLTIPATDLSQFTHVVLVSKSDTASCAGLLTIRSSAGNESDCSTVQSATVDTWVGGSNSGEALIFPFRDSSDPSVTFTGTPDFTGITEIEATVDTATEDVSPYQVYFVKSIEQAIGQIIVDEFSCISSIGRTISNEYEAVLCGQKEIGQEATTSDRGLEVGSQRIDYSSMAKASGSILATRTTSMPEVTISPDKNPQVTATNTFTLPTSDPVIGNVYLYKDSSRVELLRNNRSSAATITNSEYHQNGTTVTVPAAYGTGWSVRVSQAREITGMTYVDRALVRGMIGPAYVPKTGSNGKKTRELYPKAERFISGYDDSGNIASVTYSMKFYPVNGEFSKTLIQ